MRIDGDPDCMEPSCNATEEKLLSQLPKDACLDFQKKVTLSKHEKKDNGASSFFGNKESYEQLVGMYKLMKLIRDEKEAANCTIILYCEYSLIQAEAHVIYFWCDKHQNSGSEFEHGLCNLPSSLIF